MEYANILRAAFRRGIKDTKTALIFCEFFSQRFPDENNNITSYVDEWADRFKNGNQERYMDGLSITVYDGVTTALSEEFGGDTDE